jgi:bacterioferritin-associated ferredoxin
MVLFFRYYTSKKRVAMFDKDREICVCNSLSMQEIAECIKKSDIKSLEELLGNRECPMGDKCESCHEEGYQNDGYSLAMVLSLVKQGRL